MEKEALYAQIEAYLANTLSRQEKAAFEQQIAQDSTLKKEVELQQALAKTLGDAEKATFVKNLKTARAELAQEAQQVPQSSSKTVVSYWKPILFTLLALLVAYTLFQFNKSRSAAIPPAVQQETSPTPSTETSPAPTVPKEVQEAAKGGQLTPTADEKVAPSTSPAQRIKTQPNSSGLALSDGPKQPKRRDGRSHFDVIPQVETELTQAADPIYSIESGQVSLSSKRNQKSYDILFEGVLLTAQATPELALVLFDNRIPITDIKAVIPVQLKKIEQDPNIRAFAAKKAYELSASYGIELAPGLYYVRLQRAGDLKTLWTGKFTVEG